MNTYSAVNETLNLSKKTAVTIFTEIRPNITHRRLQHLCSCFMAADSNFLYLETENINFSRYQNIVIYRLIKLILNICTQLIITNQYSSTCIHDKKCTIFIHHLIMYCNFNYTATIKRVIKTSPAIKVILYAY